MNTKNKGFTLLEILLVMTLIGILIGILLVAINPNRQLAQARNLTRKKHITDIYNALELQKVKNRGVMLSTINTNYQEICDTGVRSITDALPSTSYCDGKIDLRVLVPTYIVSIPKDNNASGVGNTGYQVGKTESNQISIRSKNAELGQIIAINFIIPVEATGGVISTVNVGGIDYKVHTFNGVGNSTLTVTKGGSVEYLVVAGGGGGGSVNTSALWGTGGGGAGGLLSGTTNVLAQTYTITIGQGGLGGVGTAVNGSQGGNSSFGSVATAIGGGGGAGAAAYRNGGSGGSGGGGAYFGQGGAGTTGQGFAGGNSGGGDTGAGGGGAGGIGGNSGGNGLQSSIDGVSRYYAGGGGGGWLTSYLGGLGGGGNANYPGANGLGGGGGGGSGPSVPGRDGGSGIVIIRYQTY